MFFLFVPVELWSLDLLIVYLNQFSRYLPLGGFALPATYHHFLNSLLPAITEYVLSGLKKVMY